MSDERKKDIYLKLVDLLTNHCDTCLDKHRYEKILLCAFKLDLIEYATENNYTNIDELWESLAKTVDSSLDNHMITQVNSGCNCINGVCALC